MKYSTLLLLPSVLLPALVALGQGAAAPQARIVEKGAHHRTWAWNVTDVLPDGRRIQKKHSYVELSCGMNRWSQADGAWTESQEVIELFQDGAIARHSAYQVIWAPNLNSAGAIDVEIDGQRLRSHILGLGVYDTATQNSALIAEPKDSTGELHDNNLVVYQDAFSGVLADVHYVYRKHGLAQDVLLRENVTLPEGFDPQTTRLEVWTEFIEAPAPRKELGTRAGMADETLGFASMNIGPGRAFAFNIDNVTTEVPTAKRWLQAEGRTFLVEAVPYQSVKPVLDLLPAAGQQAGLRKAAVGLLAKAGAQQRPFPAAPPARAKADGRKIQMAGRPPAGRGLVLDYDLNYYLTNYVFRSDTTYYVSGTVALYQTNTAEGGTVIKMAPTNNSQLTINGKLDLTTSAYRPVTLTSRDDHSIGTQIGSATLAGYYGKYGLFVNSSQNGPWEYLRVFYASNGVGFASAINQTLRHSQFAHCAKAIQSEWGTITLENVLFYDLIAAVYSAGASYVIIPGSHLTVHQCNYFGQSSGGDGISALLTNSMLVRMTNWGVDVAYSTNAVHLGSDSSVFQTVGAASHYLASGSQFRNAGVTGISSTLAAALRQRTTYPPVVIPSGFYSNSLVLAAQAQRDTDTPDIGYHYDPADYALGHVYLNDATFTVKPGTVLATYATTAGDYGLGLVNDAHLVAEGTADNLVRIVRHNTVQERATNSWSDRLADSVITSYLTPTRAPSARFRATYWSTPAQDTTHFTGNLGTNMAVEFKDCQFFGGTLTSYRPTLNVTNCFLGRVGLVVSEGSWPIGPSFQNSTFSGGSLDLYQDEDSGVTSTWTFKNNLFDDTPISSAVLYTVLQSSNAFTANAGRLIPTNAADVVLSVTNIAFQTAGLGRFYLPTNLTSLFNSGTTNANYLGLFHYTCTTNQLRETNSVVDRGFHLVALNASGKPVDSDSDGIPDYLENFTGNGLVNSRETSWTNASDVGLKIVITKPANGSTIP